MRVVRRAEAAPGDEHVRGIADHETPIGDPDRGPVRQVLPDRVGATVMVLDGRTAQADPVVEGARGEHVVAGQPVVAVDAPRLANPDLRPERDERRMFVAGHAVDEEPDVLERLAPAGDLGLGQEPRVGGVDEASVVLAPDRIEPGHDRRDHAIDRRDVVAALAPWQVVVARLGGLGHQPVELGLGDRATAFEVHVRHPKGRRQRLGRIELAGRLVAEARERAQVGVAGRIHEGLRAHAREAGPRRDDERLDPPVADFGCLDERVEERTGARIRSRAAPRRP